MSITGNSNMGTPFFHELKKQASFFLKEKIKTARLALTDVTPAELLTEETTNGNPWAPDTRTMGLISRAAFEVDDYWRIVEILHRRLSKYDRKHWRESYKALILLEHLLTHGPESIVVEFHSDKDVIKELASFQYIDERGFNWGLTVRKKSERILQLLEKGELYKEERERARKLTRGIQGFGSFSQRSASSTNEPSDQSSISPYGRCNSHYDDYSRQEDVFSSLKDGDSTIGDRKEQTKTFCNSVTDGQTENLNPQANSYEGWMHKNTTEVVRQPLKENVADWSVPNGKELNCIPVNNHSLEEFHEENSQRESKPLLGSQNDKPKFEVIAEDDHPFNNIEHKTTASLLPVS